MMEYHMASHYLAPQVGPFGQDIPHFTSTFKLIILVFNKIDNVWCYCDFFLI